MACALIGLGSNLGNRAATLADAVSAISRLPQTRLAAKSAWIESAPVGPPQQSAYLNGVVIVETSLEAVDLLQRLHQIETAGGRIRDVRWGSRTLDLDLLLYDDAIALSERLTLPHPRMAWRRFVLEPAAQIAAEMVHPTSGMTIGELYARFSSTPPYVAIIGPPGSGKTRLAMEIARQSGCRLFLDPATAPQPPSNSAFPELDREIEFLARRTQLIEADDSAAKQWTISDFWLAQSLAWSEVEPTPELAPQVALVYKEFATRAMSARFVAIVDVSAESSGPETTSGPSDSERGGGDEAAGDEGIERLRAAMRSLVKQPGQPPAVWLSSQDWQGAVAELLGVLAG